MDGLLRATLALLQGGKTMFEQPLFLAFIPVAIVLVLLLDRQKTNVGVSSLVLYNGATTLPLGAVQKFLLILVAATPFIIWATPLEVRREIVTSTREVRDFVIDLDDSGSMMTQMEIAKEVISKFVEANPNDRIALVTFEGVNDPDPRKSAYLEWPLSLDHEALLARLKAIEPGGGTNLEAGLYVALEHLAANQSSGAVIIISDGESAVDKEVWAKVAQLAKETRARIYWIWVGQSTNFESSAFKDLVESIGGKTYGISPTELESAFAAISALEPGEIIYKEVVFTSAHYGFLFALLIIAILAVVLIESVKEV